MPQMSPMWWETLFIAFIMLFIMINTLIYWNQKSQMKQQKGMNKLNMNNWKW
uniref:ATPase subunit 8 n=1 Tax=Harmostica fulvicornis TaxID=2813413 RepID=A0A8T9VX28_9HEMI|nr:ATPase subunit 8 [Harmostica fulvicornis]UPI55328.1 ATPase subunit 8 [Harmostica fulvicornis]